MADDDLPAGATSPQPERREPHVRDPGLRDLSLRDWKAILLRAVRQARSDVITDTAEIGRAHV